MASKIEGVNQFSGTYSLPTADIETLDLTNNELTDDLLKQIVDELVNHRAQLVQLKRIVLCWNRLTIRCKEPIQTLRQNFEGILVDVRHNYMGFEEIEKAFEGMEAVIQYKDSLVCLMQEVFQEQKSAWQFQKKNSESIAQISRSFEQLERSAKNRAQEMERAMEQLLLQELSTNYDCTSYTSSFDGGKLKRSNGDDLVQWDAIFYGKSLTDNSISLFFVEVKEIPHANDIIADKQPQKKLDLKSKVERTYHYLRNILPNETGQFRAAYEKQRNLLIPYQSSSLVFAYASGRMEENIKTKVQDLQAYVIEKIGNIKLLTAESPRLTECSLTYYGTQTPESPR
eukprot:gene9683-10708_t